MVDRLWAPHISRGFDPALSRDNCGDLPSKPHPAALYEIQRQWGFRSSDSISDEETSSVQPGLLMVGDSPKNDIEFGKAAGISTALVDTGRSLLESQTKTKNEVDVIDAANGVNLYVTNLVQLPRKLWNTFHIESPLGHNSPLLKFKKPEPSTPATIAASSGDLDTLSKLSKEELRTPDETGNTPLIWATNDNNLDTVKFLLDPQKSCYKPEDINTRGYLGATALCRASRSGHVDILKYLIDVGKADMNLANDKMQYPLHFAAFKKQKEAVQVLLDRGVNTLVLDRKGRTPAEDTSDMDIRDMILKARAKVYGDDMVC